MTKYLIDFNGEGKNFTCYTLSEAKLKAVKAAGEVTIEGETKEDVDIYEVRGGKENEKRKLVATLKWCTTPYDAELDDEDPVKQFDDGFYYWEGEDK